MVLFLFAFFTLYSLLHLYLYRKLVAGLRLGSWGKTALILLLTLMVLSPVLWRTLDREGFHTLSYWVAFLSLFWMGFVIYFFIASLVLDLMGRVRPVEPKRSLKLTLFASLALSIYSHIETYWLQIYRFSISTPKLPEGKNLKILHISDLHLGPVMGEDRIRMVLDVYREENPDMVVATGDMVDGNMRGKEDLAALLSSMKPPLGKFAVLGNHEFYRGVDQAVRFLERAGFRVLRCEWLKVGNHLIVAGVDYPAGRNACSDESKALKGVDTSRFVILLKHKPSVSDEALPYIDLQLSGHSHGGVLFFIGYTVLRLIYETDRGMKELAPGKFIVVSKGVGTGGPPMRLLSPPDVVIIDLFCRGSCKQR